MLTQAHHRLPLDTIEVQIGDLLDRETLMHGAYPGEGSWYRRELVRERIRYFRKGFGANLQPRPNGPLTPGIKRVIRAYMHIIDTAYEVRVSGIDFVTSLNEGGVANQCYIGKGGAGWGGSTVMCKVIFLGTQPDDRPGREHLFNHVALNVTALRWPQHRILEAKAKLAERQEAMASRLCT